MSRQAKARKQNKDLIRGSAISEMELHKRDSKSAMKPENGTRLKPERKCMWCGGQLHKRQSCPAKDVTCNSCHKRGHFQAVCLSKKQVAKRASINEVADLEEVEVPFLGEICCSEGNFWTAIVKVDGHETHFKLDTGAAVSIVSDKEPWLKDYQLTKSQQILRGLGGTTLSVVGTFRATLTYTYFKKRCRRERRMAVVERKLHDRRELWFPYLQKNTMSSSQLRRQQKPHRFAYLTMKNSIFARFARAFFIF